MASVSPSAAPRRLPVIYVSHGSPMSMTQTKEPFYQAFRKVRNVLGLPNADAIKDAVRAIVVVSAHWESHSNGVRVTGGANPGLIYDFGGFPRELYNWKYNAPGAPDVAEQVAQLLNKSGVSELACTVDNSRGWDHGAWVPLDIMFPEATVPVVQLSLNGNLSPDTHIKMGRALAPLRDQGILIIGSGSVTHNLGDFDPSGKSAKVAEWAASFEQFVDTIVTSPDLTQAERESQLSAFEKHPNGRHAHPRTEHFVPIFVALGANLPDDTTNKQSPPAVPFFRGFVFRTLSMTSYVFGAPQP